MISANEATQTAAAFAEPGLSQAGLQSVGFGAIFITST